MISVTFIFFNVRLSERFAVYPSCAAVPIEETDIILRLIPYSFIRRLFYLQNTMDCYLVRRRSKNVPTIYLGTTTAALS